MDQKTLLAITAIVLAIIGYYPYFKDILKNKTKPHAFTWLIWATLNGIAFWAQISHGGGAGAYAVGFTSLVTFAIFVLSLQKGEKNIKTFDWFCLFGATLALIIWAITNQPLISIILITAIDIIGFLPTIRKSIKRPYEETLSTYIVGLIKYLLVIFALSNYSAVNVIFPAGVVAIHIIFIMILLIRRGVVRNTTT